MSQVDIYRTETGHELPGIVTVDGVVRLLARLPDTGGKRAFPPWSAANPVIPRSDWHPFDRTFLNIPIFNQGQTGSCVGHGSTTALQYARAFAGMQYQPLSPCCLYGQINGGRDGGAVISDALQALISTGTCLESQIPEGMIYSGRFPSGWQATAARFRAESGYTCETWDDCISAALVGRAVSFSVVAGNSWTGQLDANGCPGLLRGFGNHCVFMGSKLVKGSDGNWYFWGQNSWGAAWGQNGHFAVSEAYFDKQSGFDAFALSVAASDPSDPTNPPKVTA